MHCEIFTSSDQSSETEMAAKTDDMKGLNDKA